MQMLLIITSGAYLAWAILLLHRRIYRRGSAPRLDTFTAATALTLHALVLYFIIDTHSGQNLSLINIISLLSWAMCLLVFIASEKSVIASLAIVNVPIASISTILLLFWPNSYLIQFDGLNTELLHVIFSLMAFCLLTMGGIQAIFIVLQRYLIKRGISRIALSLPPLESMEKTLFRLILAGFILLSISLVTGFIDLPIYETRRLIEKVSAALFAWLIFAILLVGRYGYGWRGLRAVRMTLLGFIVLSVSYFGTRLLFSF